MAERSATSAYLREIWREIPVLDRPYWLACYVEFDGAFSIAQSGTIDELLSNLQDRNVNFNEVTLAYQPTECME